MPCKPTYMQRATAGEAPKQDRCCSSGFTAAVAAELLHKRVNGARRGAANDTASTQRRAREPNSPALPLSRRRGANLPLVLNSWSA